MSLLSAQGISKSYSGARVLDDVSFELGTGEIVAMIGPNGAGKTTCFNILGGQLQADCGQVSVAGTPVSGLPMHRIAQLGVARTFQIAATFHSLTVAQNLQMAMFVRRGLMWNMHMVAQDLYRNEADGLLARLGIQHQAGQVCSTLSYGDLKRVELAIALAANPRLLLMDEPTAGMAPRERVDLMALVAELARERSLGILFIEHDMDIVFAHAERILLLAQGRLICQGTPAAVRADPRARQAYLGSAAA